MTMQTSVKNTQSTARSSKRELRSRLNLVAAAEAHIMWKTRLRHHVLGTIRESMDSSPLGQDGICQLGSWINGSVLAPYCTPEVHRQLSEAHSQFHQFTMLIIEKIKAGERREAEALFENEYSESLRRMVKAMAEINLQLQEG